MAVQCQRAQLLVLEQGGEGSIVIKKHKIGSREKCNQGLENVDCRPNKVALKAL
jgi:hypothetical protein